MILSSTLATSNLTFRKRFLPLIKTPTSGYLLRTMASKGAVKVKASDQPESKAASAKKPVVKRPATAADKEVESPSAKKPRATKAAKAGEASVDELGWTIVPPSLIYRDYNSKPSKKIAGFDLDGTIVQTKSGGPFAKGPDDWKFFSKKVPAALKELQEQGYKIVLFSNQGGVKSALTGKAAATVKGKIDQMLKQAGVPAQVFLATSGDDLRKPSAGMWDLMCREHNGGVQPDKSKSFYVGDAAGRPGDFLDKNKVPVNTDREFAATVGIGFKVPEDLFGAVEGKQSLQPAAPGAAVDLASSPNAELLTIFKDLAAHFFASGDGNAKFKAIAFRKVVSALSSFPEKISEQNLKEVNAVKGVGKGSMGVIKEYMETGKVQEMEDIRAKEAAGPGEEAAEAKGSGSNADVAPKSAAAAVAFQFM